MTEDTKEWIKREIEKIDHTLFFEPENPFQKLALKMRKAWLEDMLVVGRMS